MMMRDVWRISLSLVPLLLCGCGPSNTNRPAPAPVDMLEESRVDWNFDGDAEGGLPRGWSIHETRPKGRTAQWQVLARDDAPSPPNVLELTRSQNRGRTYNLAIAEGTSFGDFDLTVAVRAVAGKEDQGGGPIWRCRDENNYYICRFNPLEDNYRVYKVVDGKRKQLASAKVRTEAGRWHTVRVRMAGDRIVCDLDGSMLLDVEDDTFPEPGRVGLWTKADAETAFDDLGVTPLKRVN